MIHKMYCIHDTKAKAFLPPFILPTEGMAIRTFADCINSDTHQFGAHPEDYGLFFLGEYDDEKGELVTTPPAIVRTGISLVNAKEEKDQRDLWEVITDDEDKTESMPIG